MCYVDSSGGVWGAKDLGICLWVLTSALPGREGKEGTFATLCIAFRQIRKGREMLHLSCLQFKIINIPKWHTLGVAYSAALQVLSEFEKPNYTKQKSVMERITVRVLTCGRQLRIRQQSIDKLGSFCFASLFKQKATLFMGLELEQAWTQMPTLPCNPRQVLDLSEL